MKKEVKKDEAIFNVLREYIEKSSNILCEGNGYGEAWEQEAARRGLSNNKTTPEALKAKISEKTIAMYSSLNVMNKVEVQSRYDIEMEDYILRLQIEGRVLGDLARNHIVPTAIKYQNTLINNVKGLKEIYEDGFKKVAHAQLELIEDISERVDIINTTVSKMINKRKDANQIEDLETKATVYCKEVIPMLEEIRYQCDKLELLVDDELWPLTKYRELLFTT